MNLNLGKRRRHPHSPSVSSRAAPREPMPTIHYPMIIQLPRSLLQLGTLRDLASKKKHAPEPKHAENVAGRELVVYFFQKRRGGRVEVEVPDLLLVSGIGIGIGGGDDG